jgi:hypothetical protein
MMINNPPTQKIKPMSNKTKEVKPKISDITPELLMADGWIKTADGVVIFEKPIPNRNPINNTPEDIDIKLIIHGYYNTWTFAILLPDGGMLNFVANSMKQLKEFENKINFYDPPF